MPVQNCVFTKTNLAFVKKGAETAKTLLLLQANAIALILNAIADELEKMYCQDELEKITSKVRLLKGRQRKEDELSKRRTKGASILDLLWWNLDADSGNHHETTQEIDATCFLCDEYFLSEQFTSYVIYLTRFGLGHKTFNLCKLCAEWNISRPKKRKRGRNRTHIEHLADIEDNAARVRRNIERYYGK